MATIVRLCLKCRKKYFKKVKIYNGWRTSCDICEYRRWCYEIENIDVVSEVEKLKIQKVKIPQIEIDLYANRDEETRYYLYNALDLLKSSDISPVQQSVIQYRYRDNKTYREIGEILGKSPCRIQQIVAKATRIIRNRNNDSLAISVRGAAYLTQVLKQIQEDLNND